jgi:ATP phosphoribosyltransferase regulatory subunit
MSEGVHKALLPTGLKDVLPPSADQEAQTVERLLNAFAARGYERVKPPLIEFEDALLTGPGAALAAQSFRLMDPMSQRMLAVRPDMTTQVARIASSRLRNAPRPLRLCYGGQVLRVTGTQMRPERQFTQAGAELVGSNAPDADAEAATLAASALLSVGVSRLALDLNLPPLVGAVASHLGFSAADNAALREALDRKDAAAVADLGGAHADLFRGLLRAAGPAETAMARLKALDLPEPVRADVARLDIVQARVRAALPDLTVTVDPVEHRGFEYQSGVSFALYATGVHGELGRGGRYAANGEDGGAEPATGFTLFMDTVMRAVPRPTAPARVYLPHGTPADAAERLRAAGWITVAGLAPEADAAAEARRLRCTHVLRDGAATALDIPGAR